MSEPVNWYKRDKSKPVKVNIKAKLDELRVKEEMQGKTKICKENLLKALQDPEKAP